MRRAGAVLFAAGVGAAILAVYLLHPIAAGHRLPVGPDGPVYVWWAKVADAEGVGSLSGRLGVPAVTLALGAVLRTEPLQTVALLGPVLAAACGLTGASLVEALLGANARRAAIAGALTAGWAGYLAAGYLGNLAFAALFLAAATALGLSSHPWRSVASGAALLVAAGLAHRGFLPAGAGILIGAAGLLAVERRHRVESRSVSARILIATLVGAAFATAASALASFGLARPHGDTSQDAFLRRSGLGHVLRDLFRERLAGDARRAAIPVAAGVGLSVAAAGEAWRWDRSRERYVRALLVSWGAVTVVGGAALVATAGPAGRLVAFAFFLPLLAAIALHELVRRGRASAILAGIAGAAMVAGGLYGWYRQTPYVDARELEAGTAAAGVVRRLPPATPLVFLVDTAEKAAAFHVTRFGNVIRATLPGDRILDARIAVGRPEDHLRGRPTLTGDEEHDRLSARYLSEARVVDGEPAVLVLRAFNDAGFGTATRLGIRAAPGVALLEPEASGRLDLLRRVGSGHPEANAGADGLGPVPLAALSLVALTFLGAVGFGWAVWSLPGASIGAAVAVAPSVGLAGTILGTVAADRLGASPGGLVGLAGVLLVGALGYVAAARSHPRDGGPA